jgi:hypothetical protein
VLVRNVAFEFNNMETDLVMPVNVYIILVERGFKLICISKPWNGKLKNKFCSGVWFLGTWFMYISACSIDRLGNSKGTPGQV